MISSIRQLKNLNRNLILISLSILIWGIGEGSFMIFQPIYLEELGASPFLIGLIIGLNGLSMALLPIPVGILTDKIGTRPILWFSWFFATFAAIIMALANSLAVFTIGVLLYGLTFSMLAPLNVYVINARGNLSTSRALSLITIFYNSGAVLGPLLGGWLAENTSLKTVYSVAAGIVILSSIIVLFIEKQEPPVREDHTDNRWDFLKNRTILIFLALIAASTLTTYFPWPLTPNFLQSFRSLSLKQIGHLASIGSIGNALIMVLFANLRPYYGWLLGLGLVAMYSGMIWLGNNWGWYGIGFLVFGGYRLIHIMYLAYAKPIIKAEQIGFFYGLIEAVNAAAIFIAPIIAGYMYNKQPLIIYPISIVCIFIVMGLCGLFLKERKTGKQSSI